MSLNKEMEQLIVSVRQPIIVFIPEDLFSVNPDDVRAQMFSRELIGLPYVLTQNNEVIAYREGIDDFKIFEKPKLLQTHMFQLLDWQSKLEMNAFNYLLENYTKELIEWRGASQWMALNAKTKVKEWSEALQGTLDFQYHCLDKHHKDLIEKFRSIETNKSQTDINVTHLDTYVSSDVKTPVEQISEPIDSCSVLRNINKDYKPPIICDREADEYLLEKVFDVNI